MRKADVTFTLKQYDNAQEILRVDLAHLRQQRERHTTLPDRMVETFDQLIACFREEAAAVKALSKPLEDYTQNWRRNEYQNPKAERARHAQSNSTSARKMVEYLADEEAKNEQPIEEAKVRLATAIETLAARSTDLTQTAILYARSRKDIHTVTVEDCGRFPKAEDLVTVGFDGEPLTMTIYNLAEWIATTPVKRRTGSPLDNSKERQIRARQRPDGGWAVDAKAIYKALKRLKRNEAVMFAGCVVGVGGLRDYARVLKGQWMIVYPDSGKKVEIKFDNHRTIIKDGAWAKKAKNAPTELQFVEVS